MPPLGKAPEVEPQKHRLMAPWNNVAAPPSAEPHPDIPGLHLHYYTNKLGLMVPLWPKVGPIPLEPGERRK
jgi:hypothetical protein